jgi:hypothetical protein
MFRFHAFLQDVVKKSTEEKDLLWSLLKACDAREESEVGLASDSSKGAASVGGLLLATFHGLDQPCQMTANPPGELRRRSQKI